MALSVQQAQTVGRDCDTVANGLSTDPGMEVRSFVKIVATRRPRQVLTKVA